MAAAESEGNDWNLSTTRVIVRSTEDMVDIPCDIHRWLWLISTVLALQRYILYLILQLTQ